MVTRKDVAKLAGVSVATVSNVMNNKPFVSKTLKEKVERVVKELNYIPDHTARNLVSRKSYHIGVAVYETTNPYHFEIIEGIEDYAAKNGYIVSIFNICNNTNKKLDSILERRLEGLVNFVTNQYPDVFINQLLKQGTRLINFKDVGSSFDNDYSHAMLEIMKRLKELGHTKVAYISTTDMPGFLADSRGKTFHGQRKNIGFELNEDLLVFNDEFDLRGEEVGYKLGKELLKKRKDVTAVFATNDVTAMGFVRAASEAGYNIPTDISIVGCDDISFSKIFVPSITTIGFDKFTVGQRMAKQIIEEINGERTVSERIVALPVFRESICKARE